MSRKLSYKVHSLDLTDGEPRHRITSRDTVDRTPFSVHGTFSGTIGIAKSMCTPELNKVSILKIWQGKDPIVVLRVNQLDNALLAVTNFHYLPVGSSLFVLDLISQCKLTVEPRLVFKATHPHILDVCWLWDHPARLLLSTMHSIRLFDIRCPNRTEQALFLNHSVTHMASNRYRTHVFAAFNENKIHIYDSRKLFGPIQQIKIPIRSTCDSFTSEEIFSMEQIWDSSLSADSIDLRLTTYKDLAGAYTLESYGEMFDKCKEDPESPMPLCWMAPIAEHVVDIEKDTNSMDTVTLARCIGRPPRVKARYAFNHLHQPFLPSGVGKLVPDLSVRIAALAQCIGRPPRVMHEGQIRIEPPTMFNKIECMAYLSDISTPPALSFILLVNENSRTRPKNMGLCTVDTTRQQPILEREGAYKCSLCTKTGCSTAMYDGGVNKIEEVSLEKGFENINEKYKDRLSFVFRQLGLDQNNLNRLCELQNHVELATNDGISKSFLPIDTPNSLLFDSAYPAGIGNGMRRNKVDDGYRIKSIPFHLYQTMKLRLYNGMDKIDNDTPLLSIMQGMADQIPKNWTQWLLNSARIQDGYCDMFKENDVSDDVEMVADDDDILIPEKSATRSEEHCHLLSLNVKGLPGILQLSTLESESDVVWHNCDSNHFTYIKIARSPIRRLILAPFRLPIDEERIVSDERFAASTDVLKQMPVIFLCLINGDSMRFIEYTLFIRRKLCKPVFTDSPCSFLNAFYFFSTVVYRYVNKISGAANKSSPKYVARRLRLVDKIYAFIKQHSGSSSLNPFLIPMLLFLHGEMTYTHPETFTRTVLENERMPLSFRIAWCLNLLSSAKMKEALHFLFQQSSGINRLQFVGLGRHPDSLTVLSEHLYVTQDCQVFSHLLVAGRCFEEDDIVPELVSVIQANLEGCSVKDKYAVSVPSLVTIFPTSYLHASNDMCV
ncbi:hypothetical protein Angca_000537, partial [Angiostrongylus cantonensis]